MEAEKNKFPLVDFFTVLFNNLPKLFLTNLIFAVPFAAFLSLFWVINAVTGINSGFIIFLTAIPLFPFYAGVTLVTSHMVRKEEGIKVFETFVRGVKENFFRFLIHGIVFYFALFFSYYSVLMYLSFGKINSIFYVFLSVSIIVAIFFLFVFFYLPPMTVTFDISMKNIYKNSALMTFGEIKQNLCATFGLFILSLFFITVLFCCTNEILVIVITIILALLFAPSLVSFITNYAVYSRMYSMIASKESRKNDIDSKIEDAKNGKIFQKKDNNDNNIADDFSEIELDEKLDGDEYIFYNGKMIKRSVLLKLKKQSQTSEESE